MNNNGQNSRQGAAPQQQLSPPTDPRKRNVPSTTSSSQTTTQQRARATTSRPSDQYTMAMPIAGPSTSEHPPLYGYVARAPPPAPPPVNVIAVRDALLMPPPPPPPPPPTPAPSTSAPHLYTAPPSVAPSVPYSSSRQIPEEFDPSQPPPNRRPQQNVSRKRGATDNIQAGSSKIRQIELPDGPCPDCVERDIRSSIYQEQCAKLEQEQANQTRTYNNRFDNVEDGKLWLKSTLGPRLYKSFEDFIETGSTSPSLFPDLNSSSSLNSLLQGTPALSRHEAVDLLLNAVTNGVSSLNMNNLMLHSQTSSTSREESLLQMLTGGGRRAATPTTDVLWDRVKVLFDALRSSAATEIASERRSSSPTEGFQRLLDALRPAVENEQRSTSERAGNGLSRLTNGGLASIPSSVATTSLGFTSRPAPAPAAPPPARPFYSQTYPRPAPAPIPAQTQPPQPPPQNYYGSQYQAAPAGGSRPYYAPPFAGGAPAPPPPQFAPPAPLPYYAPARPPPPDPRAATTQYSQFGPYPPYYPPGPPGQPY